MVELEKFRQKAAILFSGSQVFRVERTTESDMSYDRHFILQQRYMIKSCFQNVCGG